MRIACIALMTVVVAGCGGDSKGVSCDQVKLAIDGCGDDSKGASCDQVKDVVTKCYDDFCGGTGATTSFCKCWSRGQDISLQTCACVPLDLDAVCAAVDSSKVDVSNYDCSAASAAVSHICN